MNRTTSQERGFLSFLKPLMTAGSPLMKNVLTALAKSVLVPLGLTAAASATDAAIQKKIFVSGTTALIISEEEMDDIIKIVKSYEESGLLINGVSETIKDKAKEQKGGLFGILLSTLAASLLGNISAGKRVVRGDDGVIRVGEGAIAKSQIELVKTFNAASSFN